MSRSRPQPRPHVPEGGYLAAGDAYRKVMAETQDEGDAVAAAVEAVAELFARERDTAS